MNYKNIYTGDIISESEWLSLSYFLNKGDYTPMEEKNTNSLVDDIIDVGITSLLFGGLSDDNDNTPSSNFGGGSFGGAGAGAEW